LGLSSYTGGEYMPFIQAFARKNNFESAVKLTIEAKKLTPDLAPLLCANWQNLKIAIPIPADAFRQVQSVLECVQ
jgi:hypothetical protein